MWKYYTNKCKIIGIPRPFGSGEIKCVVLNNDLLPRSPRKNGCPSVSLWHLSNSSKHVLMTSCVVASLGTPHLKSHSIKWICLVLHHSLNSGKTYKKKKSYNERKKNLQYIYIYKNMTRRVWRYQRSNQNL